jgi:hypothetical protein
MTSLHDGARPRRVAPRAQPAPSRGLLTIVRRLLTIVRRCLGSCVDFVRAGHALASVEGVCDQIVHANLEIQSAPPLPPVQRGHVSSIPPY